MTQWHPRHIFCQEKVFLDWRLTSPNVLHRCPLWPLSGKSWIVCSLPRYRVANADDSVDLIRLCDTQQ